MSEQNLAARVRAALETGEGILRLAPAWVPRSFLMPGGRLKLSREDLYALGTHRGGIDGAGSRRRRRRRTKGHRRTRASRMWCTTAIDLR